MCTSKGVACIGGNSQATPWNEGCKTPIYILSTIQTTVSQAIRKLFKSTGCYKGKLTMQETTCWSSQNPDLLFTQQMQFHRIGLDKISNSIRRLAKNSLGKMFYCGNNSQFNLRFVLSVCCWSHAITLYTPKPYLNNMFTYSSTILGTCIKHSPVQTHYRFFMILSYL